MAGSYQVVITADAKRHLREIIQYLGKTASFDIAQKVRDGIEEEISRLADQPHSYGILQALKDNTIVYRKALKWSYRIIFTIEEPGFIVYVVRIDHEKSDPSHLKNLP